MSRPPLHLSDEEFRAAAREVADAAAVFLETLDERPIRPPYSGVQVAQMFGGPAPEQGMGRAVLDDLPAIADRARAGNARFFAYVAGSGEPIGALGDLYASVLNQNVTAWRSSPAATTIEQTVIRWIAEAIGCPGFSGSLTSGGSSANLMALAMAREAHLPANEHGARPGVVYASEEVHMSVAKAMAMLGLGTANLRLLPVDRDFRLRVEALEEAVIEDREAGRQAIAIIASAGTINTGAVDPLAQIARVAADQGLWLHVDGAYGAPAALAVPERFDGLALADSISLDAHKWLYQPYDCSVLLFRDPAVARQTFSHTGDYARTLTDDPIEGFAFFEESIELSRRFRALKLWLSLRWHGLAQFRAAIRRDLAHARMLADLVRAEPRLELLAPVDLSTVCFRVDDGSDAGSLDRLNAELLQRVVDGGHVYLSNATINGAFALRACFVNHRTTDEDVAAIVAEVLP
jgi:aromatic-L-amino-acid decarboxylase